MSEGQVCLPSVWGTVEGLRHKAEAFDADSGLGKVLLLPLKLVRRVERTRKFR